MPTSAPLLPEVTPVCLCTFRDDIRCDAVHCDIAGPGAPGNANSCPICWDRLRGKGGGDAPRAKCAHLGAPTGATVPCASCRGRVELKVFACGVHGRCTLAKRVEGVACCTGCVDAVPIGTARRGDGRVSA